MKTLMLYDEEGAPIKWAILDGDYTHLHDVYINAGVDEELEKELTNLIYTENGSKKIMFNPLKINPFPPHDKVILCGFLA